MIYLVITVGLVLSQELNEECDYLSVAEECANDCELLFGECIVKCKLDPACITECARQDYECTSVCPCYEECWDGCPCPYQSDYCLVCEDLFEQEFTDCYKRLVDKQYRCMIVCEAFDTQCRVNCNDEFAIAIRECPCQDNCRDGCPCDNYNCMERKTQDDIYMLVFNPENSGAIPKVPQIKVSWRLGHDEMTQVINTVNIQTSEIFDLNRRRMCSFQFKNRMFMIGGPETSRNDFRYRQLLLEGRQVRELNDLPFPFDEGTCAVFDDVNIYEEKAMACAASPPYNYDCWLFNGNFWQQTDDTRDDHYKGGLVKFKDSVVVISGDFNTDGSTELYNPQSQDWRVVVKSYKMQKLKMFTVVNFKNMIYLFGGYFDKAGVYAMNENYEWLTFSQELQRGRDSFRSLVQGNSIIHIGGEKQQTVEVWRWRDDGSNQFAIYETDFTTYNWSRYPETFLVGEFDYLD